MKILGFIILLSLFLLAGSDVFAGNTTLNAPYPAPSGSYNKVVLSPIDPTASTVCSGNNEGLLFMNTNTNQLELCVKGNPTSVPYPETCFNRFCTAGDSTCSSTNNFNNGQPANKIIVCPSGYTQASNSGNALVDNFPPAVGITVYSTVCCQGTTVTPS